MSRHPRLAFALFVAASFAAIARSEDRFLVVPFDALQLEGTPAAPGGDAATSTKRFSAEWSFLDAYAALDGAGEVYLDFQGSQPWERDPAHPSRCALRVASAATVSGRVFLPRADGSGSDARHFTLAVPKATDAEEATAKDAYFTVVEAHYQHLLDRGLPGAAWFRHQIASAHAARGAAAKVADAGSAAANSGRARPRGFDDTFDLFTGQRALSENLDLERGLRLRGGDATEVDVASIAGVTTRAMDWKALVKGLKPDLDPLASAIPADQHGLFFPSFDAMVRVFDEIDMAGTPLLEFASTSTEDLRTKERYQEQLCLPLSSVSRLLGPAVVENVAITGSDPFLPSGTDLALLFRCKEPALLEKLVQARHLEARAKGARAVEGKAGSLAYAGVRTDDRRVSSYLARIDATVVVTNSPAALERIAAALEGRVPALATADEYVWFRERYKRTDAGESAFLVLTDATIRRWASPASRIGDSRRVRAAATMSEVHARHVDAFASGKFAVGAPAAEADLPSSADIVWSEGGVRSPVYGTLNFLTPLVELQLDKVTQEEKRAYEAFRSTFQDRWRTYFDPIALRLSFSDGKLAADLTVMPLVASSEYKEFRELTLDATLAPSAGDAHEGTLFHFAAAFGKHSELGRMFSREAGPFAQQLGADPLGWIGGGIALYADRDPFWEEVRKKGDGAAFFEENFYRLPIALHVDVKDPLKLAGFLTALRAMADGAAPGMTHWETKAWHEQSYVRISAQEGGGLGDAAAKASICYAAMPDAFVLSLREDVVQHAIERRLARKEGKIDPAHEQPWLGSSLGLRAERDAVDLITDLGSTSIGDELRRAAWAALPILNEWKRRFPDADPVALHERAFGVRLTTPTGGTFTWNEAMHTMETSDYGCPAAPRAGPKLPAALDRFRRGEFGLSFEGEGLRVRAELARELR